MLVSLVSASGSPGVTTTAVALAVRWPRPVVFVEADPKGGSGVLAGFFKAQIDHPGLIDLVIAQRSDLLADALPRLLLPVEGTNARLLVGARSHEQAAGLAQLWPTLLEALRGLDPTGTDVIVDCGRLGMQGWPQPLVTGSDLTLLVMGSDLPTLAATRSWAAALAADDVPGHATRALLVGEGDPYTAREVAHALGIPMLGGLEWDPILARVYSHGEEPPAPPWWRGGAGAARRVFDNSGYARSVDATVEAVRSLRVDPAPSWFMERVAAMAAAKQAGGSR